MPKQSPTHTIGIILLVAVALLFINIPYVDEKSIAALAVLCCAVYLLIKR
jgi:hypothetical protein